MVAAAYPAATLHVVQNVAFVHDTHPAAHAVHVPAETNMNPLLHDVQIVLKAGLVVTIVETGHEAQPVTVVAHVD